MRQFFPGVHIGILRSMKSCFELFQLFTSERSPTSTLLPLQSYPRFTLCIRIVTATSTWKTVYITNIILHILKPYVRKNPISRIKQFHKAFYLKLLKSFSNRTHNIREYFKGLTHRGGGKKKLLKWAHSTDVYKLYIFRDDNKQIVPALLFGRPRPSEINYRNRLCVSFARASVERRNWKFHGTNVRVSKNVSLIDEGNRQVR